MSFWGGFGEGVEDVADSVEAVAVGGESADGGWVVAAGEFVDFGGFDGGSELVFDDVGELAGGEVLVAEGVVEAFVDGGAVPGGVAGAADDGVLVG